MGHSSVKVTETYFKPYADEQIDEMNRSLMASVLSCTCVGEEGKSLLCAHE